MWSPTHVQVLVRRAKGLNIKGKNGTNDAFVTIGLGKEKFQTSVKEKSENPEWLEQCELQIPQYGNRSEVVLKVLHRSYLGGDEFLGQLSLPLQDFDVYEKPKAKWYPLTCKPGQNKPGYRGELEVKMGFTVRATDTASMAGSVSELNKKARGSMTSLKQVGGSLLSLGGKEKKNLARLASAVSGKVEKVGNKAKKTVSSLKLNKDTKDKPLDTVTEWGLGAGRNQDPGVESDEEEEYGGLGDTVIRHPRHQDLLHSRRDRDGFQFDTLSHGSSQSSVQLQLGGMGTVSAVHTPLQGSVDNFSDLLEPAAGGERGLGGEQDSASVTSASSQLTAQHGWTPGPDTRHQDHHSPQDHHSDHHHDHQDDHQDDHHSDHQLRVPEQADTVSISSLPTYHQAMQQTAAERRQDQRAKKKIIPVQSSEEESESAPSSPAESPQPQAMSLSARYRLSQAAADPSQGQVEVAPPAQLQQPALGQKLKNSYSFRERKSPQNLSLRSQPQPQQQRRKHSVESQHSFRSVTSTPGSGRRGSVTDGPPAGPRVVLGRETSPTPSREARDTGHVSHSAPHVSRLPTEIMDKFSGQTREDLIEMLVRLQGTVECQGKKVADLEDYIDTLLIRVMDTAPVLLEKNVLFTKPGTKD